MVKLVTFTSGIKFYVLTITQNATICIAADIYKQEPTTGEFLNTQSYFSIACNFQLWYSVYIY